MKTILVLLIISVTILIPKTSYAGGVKKLHKTEKGIYPAYFVEKPGFTKWTEERQEEYDGKVSDMIQDYCQGSRRIMHAKENIANEKKVGALTGYVNAENLRDSGAIIVELQPRVDEDASVIKDITEKPITDYSCDEE